MVEIVVAGVHLGPFFRHKTNKFHCTHTHIHSFKKYLLSVQYVQVPDAGDKLVNTTPSPVSARTYILAGGRHSVTVRMEPNMFCQGVVLEGLDAKTNTEHFLTYRQRALCISFNSYDNPIFRSGNRFREVKQPSQDHTASKW